MDLQPEVLDWIITRSPKQDETYTRLPTYTRLQKLVIRGRPLHRQPRLSASTLFESFPTCALLHTLRIQVDLDMSQACVYPEMPSLRMLELNPFDSSHTSTLEWVHSLTQLDILLLGGKLDVNQAQALLATKPELTEVGLQIGSIDPYTPQQASSMLWESCSKLYALSLSPAALQTEPLMTSLTCLRMEYTHVDLSLVWNDCLVRLSLLKQLNLTWKESYHPLTPLPSVQHFTASSRDIYSFFGTLDSLPNLETLQFESLYSESQDWGPFWEHVSPHTQLTHLCIADTDYTFLGQRGRLHCDPMAKALLGLSHLVALQVPTVRLASPLSLAESIQNLTALTWLELKWKEGEEFVEVVEEICNVLKHHPSITYLDTGSSWLPANFHEEISVLHRHCWVDTARQARSVVWRSHVLRDATLCSLLEPHWVIHPMTTFDDIHHCIYQPLTVTGWSPWAHQGDLFYYS